MNASSSKKKKGFFRFIKILFLTLNFLAALMLGVAYVAPYVSPESNWWLAFFGLAYPLLVLLNLFFVVVWAFFNWRWAFLSLGMVLAGFYMIRSHLQYSTRHTFTEKEIPVSVMSYNVKNFGMYNYTKDWKYTFDKRDQIMGYLHQENADIICFQEFVNDLKGEFKTLDTLVKLLETRNVHTEYTYTAAGIIQFGIATFTRYPIAGKGRIDFENSSNNLCIFTDIVVNNDTVRVYNAHFESIHLSQDDYKYANNVVSTSGPDSHEKASRRIVSRLKAAFIDRASQAEKVAKHVQTSPYPVILCTDLNDTPASYAYHQLSKELEDAFIEAGSGFGSTYAGIFPSFRIDFIFHSSGLESYNFETEELEYSDHHPIICDMLITEE
jgi:endonuclease/exonuclease/phosphatase family metal-dependent hydrolase